MNSRGPKILINVPHLDLPGGVANFFRVIRRHLGPNIHYFYIGARTDETGIFSSLRRALRDYSRFHRELSSNHYSLVHLNPSLVPKSIFRDAIFVLVARAHSVPVVIFFRGWDEGVLSVIKRSFGWLFRYVYGNVSGVIVLADEFRRELRALGFQTPIFQLTTCVDDSVFDHSLRPTKSGTILQILFLSRLDRGKGVLEAIRSFAILKRSVPNVMMTIAGDGPERQAAEHLVKKNAIHDISFVGYVQGAKKHDLYSESDIFFFPTFYGEGMPNSILEAMAYGLPIVTRAIGGLQDFFEDERMGFITDSIDEYKFASLLERLAKNPDLCREIGKYNIQYAKQHFSASVVANTLQDIYSDVIK